MEEDKVMIRDIRKSILKENEEIQYIIFNYLVKHNQL